MTATRPQSLSDTAMAPKITEAANMSTGTVHIHNRSTNMPKRSGCTGGLVAGSGLVPCSILLLQTQTPPVRGTEGIRGSTHLCRLRRSHLAANGCLRGRLLAFNGRLAGGARCARRPARSQKTLASLLAVSPLLVPVFAFTDAILVVSKARDKSYNVRAWAISSV